MAAEYKPIKLKRTYEMVTELIKEKIFSGEFKVDDRLPTERDMAESLTVSRNSVRQAYHALELSGIVSIRKGNEGGAYICEPSHNSVTQCISDMIQLRRISLAELTEARLYLEKDMIELALMRATSDDLKRLDASVDRTYALIEARQAAHEENVAFHIILSEIARNPLLAAVYSSVMDLLLLIFDHFPPTEEASRTIAGEHRRIIALLQAKDLIRLKTFMDQHVMGSNDRLMVLSQKYRIFRRETDGRDHSLTGSLLG